MSEQAIFPVEIRRAQSSDARAIAEVHVAAWKTTYRGIIDEASLDRLSVSHREQLWKRNLEAEGEPYSCWVASQGERVIGFADGGKCRECLGDFDAELYAIYLLQDSVRKGLGSLLFSRVLSDCIKNGFRSMMAWVAERNESKRFYEALGAVLLPLRKMEKFGDSEIFEVAYGWNDLVLLERQFDVQCINSKNAQ